MYKIHSHTPDLFQFNPAVNLHNCIESINNYLYAHNISLQETPTFLNSDLFDADDSDEEVVRSVKHKHSKPIKPQRLILSDDEDDDSDIGAPTLSNGCMFGSMH